MMQPKLKESISNILKLLAPFKDIIWFLFLFVLFDFIWKIFVSQSDDERLMFILGYDITAYTDGLCYWTAKAIHWTMDTLLGYEDFKMEGITLFFDRKENLPIDIIWGCTGLKQLIMFSFIMIFYFGPIKKKLWYIPLSLFILAAINIIRLVIIFIIIQNPFPEWFIGINEWYNDKVWENTAKCHYEFYVDWFNVFHRDIFTWIYYDGVMFILWLMWEEKINKPFQKLKLKVKTNSNPN